MRLMQSGKQGNAAAYLAFLSGLQGRQHSLPLAGSVMDQFACPSRQS